MFELNKPYNVKEVAKECGVSYGTFRNNRVREEEHLAKFYDYEKVIGQKNSIKYIFKDIIAEPYIPYREYNAFKKRDFIRQKAIEVIEKDPRQTGSNIARNIFILDDIKSLNLMLSTLTIYTREELKQLVQSGQYIKLDYRWCYLDKTTNKYILMSNEEVRELRNLFKNQEVDEEIEKIVANLQSKDIRMEEATKQIGKLRVDAIMSGIKRYYEVKGVWPMNVPVYARTAFPAEK